MYYEGISGHTAGVEIKKLLLTICVLKIKSLIFEGGLRYKKYFEIYIY